MGSMSADELLDAELAEALAAMVKPKVAIKEGTYIVGVRLGHGRSPRSCCCYLLLVSCYLLVVSCLLLLLLLVVSC